MSLNLEDIKGEFREGYLRTEEVLSGMDAYIRKLEQRVAALEGQIAAITGALYEPEPQAQSRKIFVGA